MSDDIFFPFFSQAPEKQSHYSPDGMKQLSDFVKGRIDQSQGNQSLTRGAPFSDPNVSNPQANVPVYGGSAPQSSSVVFPRTFSTQDTNGAPVSGITVVPRVMVGFRCHVARVTNDPNETYKLFVQEGAFRTNTNRVVVFSDRNISAYTDIYPSADWWLNKLITLPAADQRYVWRPFKTGDTDTTTYTMELFDQDAQGNKNYRFAVPTSIELYVTEAGFQILKWNINQPTPVRPTDNNPNAFLIASMMIPGQDFPQNGLLLDRRNFDPGLMLSEHDRFGGLSPGIGNGTETIDWDNHDHAHKYLFRRKEQTVYDINYVRTTLPSGPILLNNNFQVVNAAGQRTNYLDPFYGDPLWTRRPGLMAGSGILLTRIQDPTDPLDPPTIRVDLAIDHCFNEDTTLPRTGTLDFNFNDVNTPLAVANLPAHCANKIVIFVCEKNETNHAFSIERDGQNLGCTVRLSAQYTVTTNRYDLTHHHSYTDSRTTGGTVDTNNNLTPSNVTDTNQTSDSLAETIITSTVNVQGYTAGSKITMRWMIMN